MTLQGGEYIDAGLKGGMARYMNHSCDPNCRTEPWYASCALVGSDVLEKLTP